MSPTKILQLTKIRDSAFIIGKIRSLNDRDKQVILENNLPGTNVFIFKRLYNNNILDTTESYDNNKKFNSFFVEYVVDDNNVRLGAVQNFLRVSNCNCKKLCYCESAYLTTIKKYNFRNPFYVNIENRNLNFVYECNFDHYETEIIDIQNLKCVCYCITFEDCNEFYVIEPVNTLESE